MNKLEVLWYCQDEASCSDEGQEEDQNNYPSLIAKDNLTKEKKTETSQDKNS